MRTNRRIMPGDRNFFPTPQWATRALLEKETFDGSIDEPACGSGWIAEVLKEHNEVNASDLYDRGYGTTGVDFLTADITAENIVTNPPFGRLADQFLLKALRVTSKKVAFLLRVSYLAGQRHYRNIYQHDWPQRVHVFSDRLTLWENGIPLKKGQPSTNLNGGTTDFAWFVWDRENPSGRTEIDWIVPGTRERLSQ